MIFFFLYDIKIVKMHVYYCMCVCVCVCVEYQGCIRHCARYYGRHVSVVNPWQPPRFSQSNEKAHICEELATYIEMMSSCGRVWFLAQEMRVKAGVSLDWSGPGRQEPWDARAAGPAEILGPNKLASWALTHGQILAD